MNKDTYIKKKINDYYKEKAKNKKIKEKYNKKLKEKAIIYKYRKLSEARPIYKILNSLSTRINTKLKKLGMNREFTYIQILGCSVKEFEEYLLKKMIDGMTYNNYGQWEVDHIIPFSLFDFHKLEEIKKCCNYTNLQPLWYKENHEKYNKIAASADLLTQNRDSGRALRHEATLLPN